MISSGRLKTDSLSKMSDSLRTELVTANNLIEPTIKKKLKIEIRYDGPYSLFDGSILINSAKTFSRVEMKFDGVDSVSFKKALDRPETSITVEQGNRFYLEHENGQKWMVNVLKVDSFDATLEFVDINRSP